MRSKALVSALGLLLASRASAMDDQDMHVKVKPIISADVNSAGQPIVFPTHDGHVSASLFEIPPHAVLPVHRHPFPRMGYVLEGMLRVTNDETGKSETYGPGSFVLEAVDQWHKGENVGDEPLRLLVMDLTVKGQPDTILRQR